ncbi:hypothetical protein CDL15_Pgr017001 [Punica granatum]|uniref:Uncharacterized protein n=1 Tax=Punica granatum TaxID=22663 RepID=A0A218WY85_PUNGR|nr:hypothetical protein CDL15_Pgr017001 [Punica granatum]
MERRGNARNFQKSSKKLCACPQKPDSTLCAPEFQSLQGTHVRSLCNAVWECPRSRGRRRTHVRRSRHLLFTTRRSRAVESPGSRGTRYT